MPKINVYLPDRLAAAVKDAGVPVSTVCQAALAEAVERAGRTRGGIAALRDPATPAHVLRRIGEGARKQMTPRLVTALQAAGLDEQGEARTVVASLDLLRGLVDDGENLAVQLLLSQGVELDAIAEATRGGGADEPMPAVAELGDTLVERLTMPARLACASALESVVELGHNYVGCEHLLLGLATSGGRSRELLASHGIDDASLRQAIRAASAGVALERSRSPRGDAATLIELGRRLDAIERKLATR